MNKKISLTQFKTLLAEVGGNLKLFANSLTSEDKELLFNNFTGEGLIPFILGNKELTFEEWEKGRFLKDQAFSLEFWLENKFYYQVYHGERKELTEDKKREIHELLIKEDEELASENEEKEKVPIKAKLEARRKRVEIYYENLEKNKNSYRITHNTPNDSEEEEERIPSTSFNSPKTDSLSEDFIYVENPQSLTHQSLAKILADDDIRREAKFKGFDADLLIIAIIAITITYLVLK